MTVSPEIQRIADTIREAVPAEKIYLFGSHAYGTPNEDSDYDFFVVLPDDGMKPLDAMIQARLSLIDLNKKTPVDILANYRSRFLDRSQYNTLERKVANEGVILYEQA